MIWPPKEILNCKCIAITYKRRPVPANARATLALLAEGESVGPVANAMGAATRRLLAARFDMSVLAAGAMTHQESSK